MKRNKLRYGGQIIYIPSERILSDPMKPRIYFNNEELTDLCASIEEAGILEPLTVRAVRHGKYMIVSGERRFRAAGLAGLESVPCVLVKLCEEDAAFVAVTGNLRHSELNFFEIALAVERLHKRYYFSYADIAEKLGISLNELTEKLKLLSVPPELRKKIIENGITERHVRELIRLNDDEKTLLVEEIIRCRLNVSETRQRCKELLCADAPKKQRTVTYFKDSTIFVNTIDKAIDTMKQSGIDAQSQKTEAADHVEYRVLIPK